MPKLYRPTLTRRSATRLLLGLVVLYGASLRFDALTLTYGAVERPGWLRAAQLSRGPESVLRPDGFVWERHEGRYISDPYTYLRYAREMRSFYAAHRREPIFPFATKVWLWLLDDQDVAVSFASAAFSVLAIVATYLLGAYAFSPAVGLGAAAALAVEYDVVTWGVGGWRDDAFTCGVVLSTYAALRLARTNTAGSAVLLGVVGGAALLVRITSLSFLIPLVVWLGVRRGPDASQRLRRVALAVAIAAAVVGPYVVNCWRVFGDPLYAINVHADVYREAEGQRVEESQTAARYLEQAARRRPARTLETAILGLTTYPFTIKWHGFARWTPALATALACASLMGLFLFLGATAGRALLLVLATSLVPYAMTWRLIGDWRFTEHAYPFFLMAASYAVVAAVTLMSPARLRAIPSALRDWGRVARWTAAATAVLAAAWGVAYGLPVSVATEALALGEEINVGGTDRDAVFFRDGWSEPMTQGNVKARVSRAPFGHIFLPLPKVQNYTLTVRADPYPPPEAGGPVPTLRLFVNGTPVGTYELSWNPERVGSYTVRVPASIVRRRNNQLALGATLGGETAAVRLWYVRVHPPISP